MRLCLNCCVIFAVLLGGANAEKGKLESVIVVFRHGDRTPISFYPNDPYKVRMYDYVDKSACSGEKKSNLRFR